MGLFSSSKADLKAQLEKKKGELAKAKTNLQLYKQRKEETSVRLALNYIAQIQVQIADLKAKIAKAK